MGQEFLETRQWYWDPTWVNKLIEWSELEAGANERVNQLRFTQDLIRLRWDQPALRSDNVNVFHVHNQKRVIAFHRWLEGVGRDVIVAASLNEATWYGYSIGFPFSGAWKEVFNSDVYYNWVNPLVAGNGGGVVARGGPQHGFDASAGIVIPANAVVVFTRDSSS
jgi:1,4-alpha-glucan branching enzyme